MNPSTSKQFRERAGVVDFPGHVDDIEEAPELREVQTAQKERERDAALEKAKADAAQKFRDDESSDDEEAQPKKAAAKKSTTKKASK